MPSPDHSGTPSYAVSLQPRSPPSLEESAAPSILLSNMTIVASSDIPTENISMFPS